MRDFSETIRKSNARTVDDLDQLLDGVVEQNMQPGENFEKAYTRVLKSHPELYTAYDHARTELLTKAGVRNVAGRISIDTEE